MSEQALILNTKVEEMADRVNSFMNKFKSELILKGYVLKREWNIKEGVGGRIISRMDVHLGGGIEIEKKVGKKYKVKLEFRSIDDDIQITAWPSKEKVEVSPVIIKDLGKFIEKVKGKM